MQLNNLPIYSLNLKQIINPSPLSVSPDTPVIDVITLMSQIRGSCQLNDSTSLPDLNLLDELRDGCVLVMEGNRLIGVFTERDVVRLSAAGFDLANSTIAQVMTQQVITLAPSKFQNLFSVLSLMRQHRIRHLPVVDDDGTVMGVIAPGSIRKVLQPVNLLKVRLIAEVMSLEIVAALPESSLLHLAELMSIHSVSCVVICQPANGESQKQGKIPLGIVTERDIVQFQALGLNLAKTAAGKVMSCPLFCLNPEDSLWVAHQVMQQRSVRRLVVTGRQGELLGLVTQTTLLRAFDPTELFGVVEILQQSVDARTTELKQTNQKLEQEIVERERVEKELRNLLEKEKELNDLKSGFTSMVTHEFRNPLTTILSLAQLLEHFRHKLSEEKTLTYLHSIQKTADYMNQLIEDLLLLGGADAGKLEFKPAPLDLISFCQELVEEQTLSKGHPHEISFKTQGVCANACMDEKLLRHTLSNLLSNACKYSPEGSTVYFTLSCQDGEAIFQILDRGIGIPPEDQKRLFESFHRARNVGKIPGSGLGLTIVQKCVELQGGEISVKSELGAGTTFIVKLPHTQQSEVAVCGKFFAENSVEYRSGAQS